MGDGRLAAVRTWLEELSRRRALALVAGTLVAILVLAGVAFSVYFGVLGLQAPPGVEEAVRADPNVTVETAYGGYVVHDADPGAETLGIVFYPGGRVAPDAYLPSAAAIATRANATVFVPGMPLNLAVFDPSRADAVVAGEPQISRWVVGGHSLGGAMACRYAADNADRVDGLLIVGAYCDRPVRGMPGLAVVGTRDAVLDREQFEATRGNLPTPRRVVFVEGMNHSQAGWYTGQRGGQPATISTPEAHRRLADEVAGWLCAELEHCESDSPG
ncbi:alpha/beta hydrolase [Salinirubellus salinus]|uniref:Alpha/beta hydrolase n=1 Tax=Salinirubellus salinus TaxID=1364945 RepID=A0A9E7U9Z0_9EURY|nr:alpha/beta hydrolase [Salinirubellus salinus]UWM53492.1 alpha/beta hydrolase [Salinirubellus salinus]